MATFQKFLSAGNLQQSGYEISNHTSNALLHYLVKANS